MPFPFSIVIPTYNEAAGIGKLLQALNAVFAQNGLDGEIIVVDDNSPDGTGDVVEQLARELPVRCLHRSGKLGLTSAVPRLQSVESGRAGIEAPGIVVAGLTRQTDHELVRE